MLPAHTQCAKCFCLCLPSKAQARALSSLKVPHPHARNPLTVPDLRMQPAHCARPVHMQPSQCHTHLPALEGDDLGLLLWSLSSLGTPMDHEWLLVRLCACTCAYVHALMWVCACACAYARARMCMCMCVRACPHMTAHLCAFVCSIFPVPTTAQAVGS